MKNKKTTVWIKFDLLESFIKDVFTVLGVPRDEAKICADVLISADKRGIESHGIGRLKPIYYDRIVKDKTQFPVTNYEIVRDNKATAVVDGHHGMGMVVAKKSMEMAISKAKKYGLGAVAVRNSTHYGIAAYYSMMAADKGMIGFTCTNARPSIAPTFGIEPMLGTNPMVFAMPTDEKFHFTNDYATSITQRGKIEQYARLEKKMPSGWVIDRRGKTLTDPKKVLGALIKGNAALTPLGGIGEEGGGYKGYGYATVVEILSAALQQGAFLKELLGFEDNRPVPYRLGHFFMAVDIKCFTDVRLFKKATGDILRALRKSQKAPGEKRIYTCGEKEYDLWIERKNKGAPVAPSLQAELVAMRDELGLKQYRFIFE